MKPSNYLGKYYSWTKTPATSPNISTTNNEKCARKRQRSSSEHAEEWSPDDPQHEETICMISSLKKVCLKDEDTATEEETSSTLDASYLEETESYDDQSGREKQSIPEMLFSPPKYSEKRMQIEQPSSLVKFQSDFSDNHSEKSKRQRRMYGFHQNPHQKWQHYCDTGANELLNLMYLQKKLNDNRHTSTVPTSPIKSMSTSSVKNDEKLYQDIEEEEYTIELYQHTPARSSIRSNTTTITSPTVDGDDDDDSEESDSEVYFHCVEGSSRVPFSHTIHSHASLPPAHSSHLNYPPRRIISPLKADKPYVPPRKSPHKPPQSPRKMLILPIKLHKLHQAPTSHERYQVTNTPVNSPDAVDTIKPPAAPSFSSSFSKPSSSSFFSRLWSFHSHQNITPDNSSNVSK